MTPKQKVALIRLVTLVLLCLPALHLAWRWFADDLGARPVTEATHVTGDWAVVFLLLSLALTPARATFEWMLLIHIRRRIGVAAALYALLHLAIYIADQNFNMVVVALEIAQRFYLTIGFAALLAMTALAITSTDGWQKRLRRNWQRLHRLAYPAAILALLHFFIQSKTNIGEAAMATGLFTWLMMWRLFPTKLRTTWLGLGLLTLAAVVATFGFELGWYGLVKNIPPMRIIATYLNIELAPRPAHKVLLVALAVIAAVAVRRVFLLWTKRYSRKTISPA